MGQIVLASLLTLVAAAPFLMIAGSMREDIRHRRAVRRILRNGPSSLKEWLILFPQACAKCGCRHASVTTSTQGWATEYNTVVEETTYLSTCLHCGNKRSGHGTGPGSGMRSPHLTKAQAEAIRTWPVS
jgi:hypothetical protein